MIAVGLLVLGGAAAAVILITHPFRSHETASSAADAVSSSAHQQPPASASATGPGISAPAATSPALSPSASPVTTQVTEQQAAQNLAGMLSQSVSDRSAIDQAVTDVKKCGPSLSQDPQVFQSAASSRQVLLADLAAMPGAAALPAGMLQDLSGAWQASIAADKDFTRWADDEITQGCVQDDSGDPNLVASTGPDNQATADKQAFVSLWNPIAAQYGLTGYTWKQL